LSSCVGVRASGPFLAVCQDRRLAALCVRDSNKFLVVTGYQCPACGTNKRSGGAATPGLTCFDAAPLANATRFPELHAQYRAYQTGTVDLYVQSNNWLP